MITTYGKRTDPGSTAPPLVPHLQHQTTNAAYLTGVVGPDPRIKASRPAEVRSDDPIIAAAQAEIEAMQAPKLAAEAAARAEQQRLASLQSQVQARQKELEAQEMSAKVEELQRQLGLADAEYLAARAKRDHHVNEALIATDELIAVANRCCGLANRINELRLANPDAGIQYASKPVEMSPAGRNLMQAAENAHLSPERAHIWAGPGRAR
jgi:hypothetical protein